MDIPTLVAEIRHQVTVAPLRFRGVVEVSLPRVCFAPGRAPVELNPEVVSDFKLRQLTTGCVRLKLPLVVPKDRMDRFCSDVQQAIWASMRDQPLWLVRDLAPEVKAEGRIIARTTPVRVEMLVDVLWMRSPEARWTVPRVDFRMVRIGALNRRLWPELLEDWEDRAPRWVD